MYDSCMLVLLSKIDLLTLFLKQLPSCQMSRFFAGIVYGGFGRYCPRDSKNVSYVDVGLA